MTVEHWDCRNGTSSSSREWSAAYASKYAKYANTTPQVMTASQASSSTLGNRLAIAQEVMSRLPASARITTPVATLKPVMKPMMTRMRCANVIALACIASSQLAR